MKSERWKMTAGELYDPMDPELAASRDRARELCLSLNATRPSESDERRRILRRLFAGGAGASLLL
jgi:maltose O-acetyltransferase